jgi:cytochrome c
VVAERQRNCRMRRAVIAGLLLAGSATAALAADPAAGQKIFKTQCAICRSEMAGEHRIGPTLYGVVGRPAGSVPGFNYTADHKKLGVSGTPPLSTSTSPIPARWCRTRRWSTLA